MHKEHSSLESAEIYESAGRFKLWKKESKYGKGGEILGKPFLFTLVKDQTALCMMNSCEVR